MDCKTLAMKLNGGNVLPHTSEDLTVTLTCDGLTIDATKLGINKMYVAKDPSGQLSVPWVTVADGDCYFIDNEWFPKWNAADKIAATMDN